MTDVRELFYKKRISQMFLIARAFAILTVVSAHITIKTSSMIADFYNAIGSVGVIVFLIISGYYYKSAPLKELIPKKVKGVIIPWIVLGTAVWFVNSLLTNSGYGIFSLLQWLIGYKTYLYYIPVLLLCFVLFYYNNIISLIFALVLNVLSIVLTNMGVLQPIIQALHITNYLNVFNWIGFFAIGVFLKRISPEVLYCFFKKTNIFFIILSVCATVVLVITGYKVGYFSAMGWLYELVCAIGIFGLCTHEKLYNKLFVDISNASYAIYLLHMMFTGVLAKVYGLHPALLLLSNIIVLGVTYTVLFVGRFVFSKAHLEKVYGIATGVRCRE